MASPAKNCNIPQRVLQTLAVACLMFIQVISFFVIPVFIFRSSFWWIFIPYIAWYLTFDKDSEINGKRRSEWVRSWTFWHYVKNYFPVKVVRVGSEELDPKRNYLFCIFPHGVLCAGSSMAFFTNYTEFQSFFPQHKTYLHTVSLFYKLPLMREVTLSTGGVNASKKALETILGKTDGGNISGLLVGGAHEAYYAKPGVHKIVLKKRKGFIKMALTQGAPLVPVYNFGENELFTQLEFGKNFIFQKFREFIKKSIGFPVIFPIGRKDLLGLIPRRHPITVVVGAPIDVQKTENPTPEQIDNLHELFQKKLMELFESQKKSYLKDHETAHLEIS